MKKMIQVFQRSSYLVALLMTITNFTATAQTKIFHIQNYFSEAYLVQGNNDKLILIETGVPIAGYQDSLVNSIKKLGFKPENISLAIVTHGHGDHAGNAAFLQKTYHIPIAGSKADLDKFRSGKTQLSKSEDVSIWGQKLRPYSDLSYQPFTPDVLVDTRSVDLSDYGVNGKIIPIRGGHTPGDLLVLIDENLFVGDAFVGTFKAEGGGLLPDGHHVREHFFHENRQLADQNLKLIEKIAIENKVKAVYPTHNGPVTPIELSKYIREEPLLKLLSQQETNMLADVIIGKSDLQNKLLSVDFILQTAANKEYNKKEFTEAYITDPKIGTELLSVEDFRIVTSTENIAILMFIETIKLVGKDASSVLVTETYYKDKGIWKLLYKNTSTP